MPVKDKQENTQIFHQKLQKRWEQEFPDKRCVMVPDPDKLQGRDRSEALATRARYYNLEGRLRYQVLPLDDEARIRLMDSDMSLLMACPLSEWQAYQREKEVGATPDETEDEIF